MTPTVEEKVGFRQGKVTLTHKGMQLKRVGAGVGGVLPPFPPFVRRTSRLGAPVEEKKISG